MNNFLFLFVLLFFLLSNDKLIAQTSIPSEVTISPSDSSTSLSITHNSQFKEGYILKDGVIQKVLYLPQWLDQKGKLKNFILNETFFHVSNQPTVTLEKKIIYTDKKVKKDYTFSSHRAFKSFLEILTPEIAPPLAYKQKMVFSDNLPYQLFFKYRLLTSTPPDFFFKDISWNFSYTNLDHSFEYQGPQIKIFPLKLPNYNYKTDKYRLSFTIKAIISASWDQKNYTDFLFTRTFTAEVIDRIKPLLNFQYNLPEKLFCRRKITIDEIFFQDNNVNLSDEAVRKLIKKFYFYFSGANGFISPRFPIKNPINIGVSKKILLEPVLRPSMYFYIDSPQIFSLPLNYEGPLKCVFQATDGSRNYTYEVFSGELIDNISPYFSLIIDDDKILSLNSWTLNEKYLFSQEVSLVYNLKILPQKRYKIQIFCKDNIDTNLASVDIYLNRQKLVSKNNLSASFSYQEFKVLAEKNHLELQLKDKHKNLRHINVFLQLAKSSFYVNQLDHKK